jgi:cellulose synthase/poly-beta-1,6-N-acetylglucosamine synthase-like glycosyltransferase
MSELTPTAASPELPSISVVVPVRNERHQIPDLLAAIEAQTLRPVEVLVADGRSDDGTLEWLRAAARSRPWLRVVENPARVIPSGLNLAIARARGEVVARMDAHASYAPDYLRHLATVLAGHPEVVGAGGAMTTGGRGPWGRAIAAVLRRRIGLGGARHRTGGGGGPIEHVFSGAYRRRALVAVGGYDPTLHANEDFEVDHRLRRAGGTIWLEPRARVTWYTRESATALARQMWRYGFFKARTLWLHPRSLRPRQLAPPALVLCLTALTVGSPRLGITTWLVYLGTAVGLGAVAGRSDGASPWRAGLATPTVHLCWGLGLLVGLLRHREATQRPLLPLPGAGSLQPTSPATDEPAG